MKSLLTPPTGERPVRLLIDTDTANEIDDQYALAWALLSPEHMSVEAVTAEPFSFAHHRPELLAAERAIDAGNEDGLKLVGGFQGWVQRLHALGRRVEDLQFALPPEGMELSHQEILAVHEKLGMSSAARVFRGATRYMTADDDIVSSEAVEVIIDLAKSGTGPLHIAAMGCVTNIASAILRAPEIRERIVVIWTSGYPSKCTALEPAFTQPVSGSSMPRDSSSTAECPMSICLDITWGHNSRSRNPRCRHS